MENAFINPKIWLFQNEEEVAEVERLRAAPATEEWNEFR